MSGLGVMRLDRGAGADPATASCWFLSPRRALRGWGAVRAIDLPAPWVDHVGVVAEVLAELAPEGHDPDGPAGVGPVAFGALPFDRDAPARLVVPARIEMSIAEGEDWVTVIDAPAGGSAGARVAPPGRVTVHAVVDLGHWRDAVAEATRRIRDGELTKVVLARELVAEADRPWDHRAVGAALAAAQPQSLRFGVDGFVGASPELLVSRLGDVVRAHPMAGTTLRTGDAEADARRAAEMLSSAKMRAEHQITIDVVHDTLLPWCSYLDAEPEPSAAAAGGVQHLATLVEGRLSHPAASVLELVAALHPTPAVGGWPRDRALALIDELEHGDRGTYAGPVGWVDASGNGAWAVGIRSVRLDGPRARLWAGVGVVADSDPLAELEETRSKFAATLPHLLRL